MAQNAEQNSHAAFIAQLNKLFKDNKSAVQVASLDYNLGGYAVSIESEVLRLDTADTGSEAVIERVKDGAEVPEDFDIDTVITVEESELLMTVKYYLRSTGVIEVHVSYDGFDGGVVPLDVYTSLADDRIVNGISEKLHRSAALFPEGVPHGKGTKQSAKRAPRKGTKPYVKSEA
jgi:hypothetical protein